MEKWFVKNIGGDFYGIAREFGIDPVIARLMINRGLRTKEEMRVYLSGGRADIPDPALLKGTEKAAALLLEKIREGKRIRIIGDYDIDGVNATYILFRGLSRLGAKVDYEIPDRINDGFGINDRIVEDAFRDGVDTLLTCDNGIAGIGQARLARTLGMTMIITDHHEPMFEEEDGERRLILPEADVLIDPSLPGETTPHPGICGAVVAWKLVGVLWKTAGIPAGEEDVFLWNAAFATIGDVMDLTGENRTIVRLGLEAITRTENRGMRALIRATGLEGRKISAYHIGYVLGPCINASGRLETAKEALQLFLAESDVEAAELAERLRALNEERKDMTAKAVEAASAQIAERGMERDRVLVIFLPDCHESVAGIVAGKIREQYNKPAFVLTRAKDGIKGSGRSIETWSMFEEMSAVSGLFTKFGGHPMAAGLSMTEDNIDVFRREINARCRLTEDDLTRKVEIDMAMPIGYISERLCGQLSLLEPCGKGNTKPLFAARDLGVSGARVLGANRNAVRLGLFDEKGAGITGLYFGDADAFLSDLRSRWGEEEVQRMLQGRPGKVRLTVTYYPDVNEFRGTRSLQITIRNYR